MKIQTLNNVHLNLYQGMTHRKPSWTKYWCRLRKARLECWDSEEESKDAEGKPKIIIKLNKVRKMLQ